MWCANSSPTHLLNAKNVTSYSVNTANLNWIKQAVELLLEDIPIMNLMLRDLKDTKFVVPIAKKEETFCKILIKFLEIV